MTELSPEAISLCAALSEAVLRLDPKAKVPNIPSLSAKRGWGCAARLLLERDGRPHDEALRVIAWATNDSFWQSNILSIRKLRKQYTRLLLQMKGKTNGRKRDPAHQPGKFEGRG